MGKRCGKLKAVKRGEPNKVTTADSGEDGIRVNGFFVNTPKHGSWLDMAEIEIGILCRQALAKPLPDFDSFRKQVRSWTIRRNSLSAKIYWQFTTGDARVKLARLYSSYL